MINRKSLFIIINLLIIMLLSTSFVNSISINLEGKNKDYALENRDDIGEYGSVRGSVFVVCFPPPQYIQGAKLTLEGDHISRISFSGLMGKFRFNFVPVGRQYTLTATHPKYKTVTETFNIMADVPDFRIGIGMYEKDVSNVEYINYNKSCTGSIYGNAGTSLIWGFSPVIFAKITAGGKTTYSSPVLGKYKIAGLPFGTYTVVGSKKGYDTFSDTVTLTLDHPDKQVFINLESNNENLDKQKNRPGVIKNSYLFSFTSFCSNTRSNLLSTLAFMS